MVTPGASGYRVCDHLDVRYLATSNSRHTLDVCAPVTTDAALRPVVLFVHGGGWKWFSKRSAIGIHQNVPRAFAERGYVAFSPNYRLSRFSPLFAAGLGVLVGGLLALIILLARPPGVATALAAVACVVAFAVASVLLLSTCWRERVRHPMHAQDVAHALAWVVRNAPAYGGDPTRVFLSGHSAGGHLVATLLTQPAMLRAAGLSDPKKHVVGAVIFSGVFDAHLLEHGGVAASSWLAPLVRCFRRHWFLMPAFGPDPSAWAAAFPTHATRDVDTVRLLGLPPMLLINATHDAGLEAHAALWGGQLCAAGVHVERFTVPGADHLSYLVGIGRRGWQGEEMVMPVVSAFLRQCLQRGGVTSGAGAMPPM